MKTLPPRKFSIASGLGGLPSRKVRTYRERWAEQGFELPEIVQQPVGRVPNDNGKPGTHLTQLAGEWIRKLPGMKKGCQSCSDLAKQMDKHGIAWSRANRERIVGQMVANASQLHSVIPAAILKPLLDRASVREKAGELLDNAIAAAEADAAQAAAQKPTRPARSRTRRGRRQDRAQRIHTLPVSTTQAKLHRKAQQAKPPEPMPFIGTPRRSMIWHIWPVEGWRWHVPHIKQLAQLCEGPRLIGIATCDEGESAEAVKSALGDGFTFFEFPNAGQHSSGGSGEVPTLRWAQTLLPVTDPDSVTIYGHCKGVRTHTRNLESVRLWTESMYNLVAFNTAEADAKFAEGYRMFGSFRTHGSRPLTPHHDWHFSGTFFQFRTAAVMQGKVLDVKGNYGGTEAWPGDHVPVRYSWCSFGDGFGLKAPYDIENWPRWIDQQFEWEVKRIGGPRTEQHQRELQWFLNRLFGCRSILIIGSKHGGLEYHIQQRYPDMRIVSVDIDPQADNQAPDMHRGSSQDPAIQKRLQTEYRFDAVFIDGDHTLAGVTADWEFAQTLRPKRIFFHDILDGLKHRREGCVVDPLWDEIKATRKTDELCVGVGWGGIGEVQCTQTAWN